MPGSEDRSSETLHGLREPYSIRALWAGLVIIGLSYLVVGALYVVYTPDWQVPDEPAHYNYIRQLAEADGLPVLEPGDYDQEYLSALTSQGFPAALPVDSLEYEDHQPPLYYLLATPVYLASDGALRALRSLSLLLGAGVIVFSGLAVWQLFPGHTPLALTVAGFVAFIPQHVAMLAGVNNDSLSELWIAVGLWLAFRCASAERPLRCGQFLALGLVLGLAMLTKSLAYVLVPVAGVMLLLKGRREEMGWRELVRLGAWVFLPPALFGSLWWGRNVAAYGWPDVMGLQRHAAVVVGQPRTGEWLRDYGTAEYLLRFANTTFDSFWGQFGWMGVMMDGRVYRLLQVGCVALIVGLALAWWQRPTLSRLQREGLVTLFVGALVTAAMYVGYNVEFVQHQGRYLFPALLPLGLAAAAGLWGWTSLLERAWPQRARRLAWLPAVVVPGMALFALFALFRFVVPALT